MKRGIGPLPGISMHSAFVKALFGSLLTVVAFYFLWPPGLWLLVIVVPFALLGIYEMLQKEHSIRRNFPLFGRGRWIMEEIRPFIRQYFVESDTDGAPLNRMFRSIVYQRAKGALETVPFGTRVDTYRTGYEWIGHFRLPDRFRPAATHPDHCVRQDPERISSGQEYGAWRRYV